MNSKTWLAVMLAACTAVTACKKNDNNTAGTAGANTWVLTPDDGKGPETYRQKTITLRTNVQQVLEAASEDNTAGGNSGISSTITLYFPTIGPPPSGTYKVTAYDKLKNADEVAVYVQTYGDPRTGGNITGWLSRAGDNQTLSYRFENGKAAATAQGIIMTQSGSGPATAKIAINISQ